MKTGKRKEKAILTGVVPIMLTRLNTLHFERPAHLCTSYSAQ